MGGDGGGQRLTLLRARHQAADRKAVATIVVVPGVHVAVRVGVQIERVRRTIRSRRPPVPVVALIVQGTATIHVAREHERYR